jgi:hypothetical protein
MEGRCGLRKGGFSDLFLLQVGLTWLLSLDDWTNLGEIFDPTIS